MEVYTLRFVNVSSKSIAINWRLKVEALDWEKIVSNGVGQSFALSLSLFSTGSDWFGSSTGGNGGGGGNSGVAGSGSSNISGSGDSSAERMSNLAIAGSGVLTPSGSMGPIPNSLLVSFKLGIAGCGRPLEARGLLRSDRRSKRDRPHWQTTATTLNQQSVAARHWTGATGWGRPVGGESRRQVNSRSPRRPAHGHCDGNE